MSDKGEASFGILDHNVNQLVALYDEYDQTAAHLRTLLGKQGDSPGRKLSIVRLTEVSEKTR